jgi:SAM-dependent methyltransferase
MPDLDTTLHLDMLHDFRREEIPVFMAERRGYATRPDLEKAIKSKALTFRPGPNSSRLVNISDLERLFGRPRGDIYGMHWGDPEIVQPLNFIKRHYLLPLVKPEHTGIEIGAGGGRWTQYLTGMQRLYVIDFYQEMLDELARRFRQPNIVPVKNNGDDFPGIADGEADLIFSFDCFVHLDLPLVERYLRNMARVLKPGGKAFIHYSDKRKIMASLNPAFAENDPETMRSLVISCGYRVVEEDTTTMWHSSIVIFER